MAVASEPGPLLFIVDDAHWLDRSSARILAFLARRVADEAVGVLFATRDPGGDEREQSQTESGRRCGPAALVAAGRRAEPPSTQPSAGVGAG